MVLAVLALDHRVIRMSQRTADELENRRGLALGLTLAEVLLLLLFLILLALSWRMMTLQRDARTAQEAIEHLQRSNAELAAALHSLQTINADLGKLKLAEAALVAASEINPNDPAEVLIRAVATLKQLGPDTRPDQVRPLSEMLAEREKLKALDKAIALGLKINPDDPAEAVTRATEILAKLGPDTKPEEVLPIERIKSLSTELARVKSERDNLMRTGNGLTYPSCWRTPDGKTEYIFDITIRDGGMIVRNATSSRMNDPAMQLVAGITRNELINENAFRNETAELFNYSKGQNCRFYSIIRDDTGSTSKLRYKELRSIVENHFYIFLRSDQWTDVPVGGPFVAPKP